MALLNYAKREVNAKIVYYGPGLCGKTTNIKFVHEKLRPDSRGKLLSLATETDRTLFFDFLPVEIGEVKGFKTRFHLYTVPGQVFYNATRQMVLKGADGVVFVADSQRSMLDANLASLANLRENLIEQGRKLDDIPMVIQCNKRDLPDVMTMDELNRALNPRQLPIFAASAMKGEGVVQTLTSISKMVLHKLQQTTGMDTEDGGPDKSMAASYRALRKEADRIGTEPHAPSPPPPPPPPPLVVEKVGTVRQNGERLLLPVQLQVHGESRIYRIELQLAVTGATPVATVERFDKEPT
jgi:hypothetical protein